MATKGLSNGETGDWIRSDWTNDQRVYPEDLDARIFDGY